MKKFFSKITALIIVVSVVFLSACNSATIPEYYEEFEHMAIYYNGVQQVPDISGIPDAPDQLIQRVEKFQRKIEATFSLEKKEITVKAASKDDFNKISANPLNTAGAIVESNTFIISSECEVSDFTIAHELLHLYAKGYKCNIKDEIWNGSYLNEGLTNYFTMQLLNIEKLPEEVGYAYETHTAKQLVEIFGKSVIEKSYFSGDWSEVSEMFNDALGDTYKSGKVLETPIQIFGGLIDGHGELINCIATGELSHDEGTNMISGISIAIEEFIKLYAECTNSEITKLEKNYKDFLQGNPLYATRKTDVYN